MDGAALGLGALWIAASIGVRVERFADVSSAMAGDLADAIGRAVERRSRRTVVSEPIGRSPCGSPEQCAQDLRARTGCDSVVSIKIFGGLTRHRVVADRFDPGRREPIHAEANVPESMERRADVIESLARALFPELPDGVAGGGPNSSREAGGQSAVHTDAQAAPWPGIALLGGGIVAATAATVLGLSSFSARDRIRSDVLSGDDYGALKSRTEAHGIASGALFGAALVALFTGTILVVLE